MARTEPFAVSVAPTVRDIGREAWSTLDTRRNLYLGYQWLSGLDQDPRFEPHHLVVWGSGGRIVAAMPVYRWNGLAGRGMLLDPYFQFVEPAVPGPVSRSSWFPVLLSGGLGSRNGLLFAADLDLSAHQSITRMLLGELGRLGQRLECASVVLMYLDRPALNEVREGLDGARAEAPILVSLPDTVLPIEWDGFAGYAASMTANRRRSMLQELLRFQRNGGRVSSGGLREWVEPIARLVSIARLRRGPPESIEVTLARLQGEAVALGELSRVFLCHVNGVLVGASITYEWDGVLYVRDWGFDHLAARPNSEYFVLHFYAPIQHAIERSLFAVNFGPVAYEAKLRRGLRPDPRFSIILSAPEFPRSWLRAEAGWNAAFKAAFRHDYSGFMDARAALVDLAP